MAMQFGNALGTVNPQTGSTSWTNADLREIVNGNFDGLNPPNFRTMAIQWLEERIASGVFQ